MTQSRILALDDDPAMRALFPLAFRHLPVHLTVVENETEAQHSITEARPNLFLIDLHLGEGNGLEVAEQVLHRADIRVPIVLVTATATEPVPSYLRSGRCIGVLFKPICLSTFGAAALRHITGATEEIRQVPTVDSQSLTHLSQAFLESSAAKARDLIAHSDGDLLSSGTLAQAAHRWIGTSGIQCLPRVALEARELEKLALDREADSLPEIRRLLAEIVNKFDRAKAACVPTILEASFERLILREDHV